MNGSPKKSENKSPVDPKTQILIDMSKQIADRIEELLNTGTQSIKAMEDEKTRVEEYRKLIYNMHNAYKKGDWTPGQNTDTENMKFINSTIDDTNRYYENNKRILDERIAENRKLIEKFTVEKAKIDAQIEAIKRK